MTLANLQSSVRWDDNLSMAQCKEGVPQTVFFNGKNTPTGIDNWYILYRAHLTLMPTRASLKGFNVDDWDGGLPSSIIQPSCIWCHHYPCHRRRDLGIQEDISSEGPCVFRMVWIMVLKGILKFYLWWFFQDGRVCTSSPYHKNDRGMPKTILKFCMVLSIEHSPFIGSFNLLQGPLLCWRPVAMEFNLQYLDAIVSISIYVHTSLVYMFTAYLCLYLYMHVSVPM